MISPASRYSQLDGKLILPGSGGNLARVICNALSSQTGQVLFLSKTLKKLLRQITNAGGVFSFPSHSAGAASRRRCNAKSLPLPCSEVNHVAHVLSPYERKFNRSAFA